MSYPRPLYVMIKPPTELADAIGALPQAAASRPANLIHTTLLPLGDRMAIDASAYSLIRDILDSVATTMAPFRVVFDRIHDSGKTIALRPSEPLRGALTFQRVLAIALGWFRCSVMPRYIFRPHSTLAYRCGIPREIAIDPISWVVEDIRLIESVVGETRHVEHGRWTLGGTDRAA